MKTIGFIGGMSWESTVDYYKIANQVIKQELGGLHSAKCLLYSVDFYEMEQYQLHGEWEKSAKVLGYAAQMLENAGADFIVICTNTMHKVASDIEKVITIPILHIAQMTSDTLKAENIQKIGLLGTRFTMEQDFYKNVLEENQIEVIIPNKIDRKVVHDVIYEELCLGVRKEASKSAYLKIVQKLYDNGAEGVIFVFIYLCLSTI